MASSLQRSHWLPGRPTTALPVKTCPRQPQATNIAHLWFKGLGKGRARTLEQNSTACLRLSVIYQDELPTRVWIERTEECFGLKPERLAGDTAYGSGANLERLVNDANIAPLIGT